MKRYFLLIVLIVSCFSVTAQKDDKPRRKLFQKRTELATDSLANLSTRTDTCDWTELNHSAMVDSLAPSVPTKFVAVLDSSHYFNDTTLIVEEMPAFNLDSAYLEWYAQGFLKLNEDCQPSRFDSSTPSDQVYLQRLTELPNVVPCSYNQIVKRFIELYTKDRRQQVSTMLALSEYYFPIFEQAIEELQLPQELKYLPVIESGLNAKAVSRMGATGLWQFMYATGKLYGLQINSLTDERRDPIKSTYAALRFLKSLYDLFGDWNLAIAAYNCGPGNVRKAISRSGGQRDFWKIYYHLPRETRSYVPLFIAANYVMTYHEEHGICPSQIVEFPLICDTFEIRQNMHFKQLSEVCHIPMKDLQDLNPHFRNNIAHGTSDKPGYLYLPAQYTPLFIQHQDSVPLHKKQEYLSDLHAKPVTASGRVAGEAFVYRVRSGDNLSSIARRYGVTVSKLKSWNNLKSDFLQIGQRLIIY